MREQRWQGRPTLPIRWDSRAWAKYGKTSSSGQLGKGMPGWAVVTRGNVCHMCVASREHFFYGQANGTFLEMGAVDGEHLSNSLWFARRAGWRGLLIEALPGQGDRCCCRFWCCCHRCFYCGRLHFLLQLELNLPLLQTFMPP